MKCLIVYFILLSTYSYAQSQLGMVNYLQLEKQPSDPDYTGNGILKFSKTNSMYTEKSVLADKEGSETNGETNETRVYSKPSTSNVDYIYTNFSSRQILSNERILAKYFPVKDTLIKPNWKMVPGKRKIGNYDCLKAITTFRNRTYTAWFTPAIPISAGPWKLWGLPGLILEATSSDEVVRFLFQSIQLTPAGPALNAPKESRKPVTLSQFVTFRKEKFNRLKKAGMATGSFKNNGVTVWNTFSVENFPNE
ncbi:GLPGLI family protein [Siphonobacter sp. SORGH_AS_0500]|uniref:GLPGLI family protein n=1 Tax=Siphonobacter sp. SORGH_AS_0500 TaxID=1864824 RepID=UPI002859BAB1|nr:GLPGLI family protein [Siphonobacter sp. SORGH_AS_0500]MDR6194579.1 GLPGLI family protein [Siphonobacter sp. SORGH_AS_0500]